MIYDYLHKIYHSYRHLVLIAHLTQSVKICNFLQSVMIYEYLRSVYASRS